jgi:PadR family transcriptional regulator AphA
LSLQNVLLALLHREPNTGYGISRLFRGEARHLWDAHLQQIYAKLADLHARGLVDMQEIDLPKRQPKKIYRLTAAGERALDAWLAQGPKPRVCRDELLVWLSCLDRLSVDLVTRVLQERLAVLRRSCDELREHLARLPRNDPSRLGLRLTLEAAIARDEAAAGWCERVIRLLQEADEREPAEGQPDATLSRSQQAT